jgi:uncharacterized membrane protein YgcG
VFSFGASDSGQVGQGNTTDASVPAELTELAGKGIFGVVSGGAHSLALGMAVGPQHTKVELVHDPAVDAAQVQLQLQGVAGVTMGGDMDPMDIDATPTFPSTVPIVLSTLELELARRKASQNGEGTDENRLSSSAPLVAAIPSDFDFDLLASVRLRRLDATLVSQIAKRDPARLPQVVQEVFSSSSALNGSFLNHSGVSVGPEHHLHQQQQQQEEQQQQQQQQQHQQQQQQGGADGSSPMKYPEPGQWLNKDVMLPSSSASLDVVGVDKAYETIMQWVPPTGTGGVLAASSTTANAAETQKKQRGKAKRKGKNSSSERGEEKKAELGPGAHIQGLLINSLRSALKPYLKVRVGASTSASVAAPTTTAAAPGSPWSPTSPATASMSAKKKATEKKAKRPDQTQLELPINQADSLRVLLIVWQCPLLSHAVPSLEVSAPLVVELSIAVSQLSSAAREQLLQWLAAYPPDLFENRLLRPLHEHLAFQIRKHTSPDHAMRAALLAADAPALAAAKLLRLLFEANTLATEAPLRYTGDELGQGQTSYTSFGFEDKGRDGSNSGSSSTSSSGGSSSSSSSSSCSSSAGSSSSSGSNSAVVFRQAKSRRRLGRGAPLVPIERFYSEEGNKLHLDALKHDYRQWQQQRYTQQQALQANESAEATNERHPLHIRVGETFTLCGFPFLLECKRKQFVLALDAQMQMGAHAQYALIGALFGQQHGDPRPYLVIRVRRTSILQDTLDALSTQRPSELKKLLKVEFVGEEGVDAGGVKKEFFQLLMSQLLDVKYGMFVRNTETNTIWFNMHSHEQPRNFFLIGVLFGLALYNAGTICSCNGAIVPTFEPLFAPPPPPPLRPLAQNTREY